MNLLEREYLFKLQAVYLDYFNNYLTVEKFANDKGWSIEQAQKAIELGKEASEKLLNYINQDEAAENGN
jgi:hypothetical protein